MNNQYSKYFNNADFSTKIKKTVGKIPFAEDALALYFALLDNETPIWVKVIIVGALGYFIFPFDAIPDVIPIAGYTDDAAVLFAAINSLSGFIKEEHHNKAKDFLRVNHR
ncbi:MAG: hypothetical protein COW71_06425 [Ignavibacteriales bacterium CG18_big_fil_WC_8_21_14_2_50_31_20]|nr:MAG: hypothetical protein COW71_06425 [Ignavibacteriales bacterium CG18_big_fil_WC_8_21_14_2_50_31_20]